MVPSDAYLQSRHSYTADIVGIFKQFFRVCRFGLTHFWTQNRPFILQVCCTSENVVMFSYPLLYEGRLSCWIRPLSQAPIRVGPISFLRFSGLFLSLRRLSYVHKKSVNFLEFFLSLKSGLSQRILIPVHCLLPPIRFELHRKFISIGRIGIFHVGNWDKSRTLVWTEQTFHWGSLLLYPITM